MTQSPEPRLLSELLSTAGVKGAELHWSPGLEVRIHLAGMDWDARSQALRLVRAYVDSQEHVQSASARFSFDEPRDFTEALVEKDQIPA